MRNYTLTKGNRRLTILAIFIIFALICATIFSVFVTAYAEEDVNQAQFFDVNSKEDDLYTDDAKPFDRGILDNLFNALGYADFAAVEQAAAEQNLTGYSTSTQYDYGGKDNGDFRNVVDEKIGKEKNQFVYFWFGGKEWEAVHLLKDNSGDVILTVCQSVREDLLQGAWGEYAIGVGGTYSGKTLDGQSCKYAVAQYSISQARVIQMNAGGYTFTSSTDSKLSESRHEQDPNHTFAKFTMDSVDGSLTKYIVKPADVKYQASETQRIVPTSSTTTFYNPLNDAYTLQYDGCLVKTNGRGKIETTISGLLMDGSEVAYDAWKNDYLWLPSYTEYNIWEMDGSWDREGTSDREIALRSGGCDQYTYKGSKYGKHEVMGYSGRQYTTVPYDSTLDVVYIPHTLFAPAFHFNLTKAYEDSEYKTSYTFDLPDNVDFVDPDGTAEIEITAHDIFLPAGKTLTLYVKSTNGMADSKFCIMLEGKQVDYTVTASGDHVVNGEVYDPTNGQIVWRFAGEGQIDSETFTITLTVTSPPGAVGDWTDSLIFTAVVT